LWKWTDDVQTHDTKGPRTRYVHEQTLFGYDIHDVIKQKNHQPRNKPSSKQQPNFIMSFARNAINLVLAPRAKPKPLDLGDLFNVSSGSSGSVEILSKVDAGASGLPVAQDAWKSDYSLDNGRVLSSPFESGKNGIVTMGMTNHPSSGTPKVTPGEAFKTIGGQSFTLFMRGGSSSGESGIHGSFVVSSKISNCSIIEIHPSQLIQFPLIHCLCS
jgi:hypothetical protein